MNDIKYSKIGKLKGHYKHEPRIVTPCSPVATPELVLKMYTMEKSANYGEGIRFTNERVGDAKSFLEKEILAGNIDPLLGLGFAILSDDMLNVVKWDEEHPIVLRHDIFGYENDDISKMARLDMNDCGSFCIWEMGIANHEKNAWGEYLASLRTKFNKQHYLGSLLRGNV
ncbi:hypothetical protein ACFL96_12665 [Thermoproteota archaeon]